MTNLFFIEILDKTKLKFYTVRIEYLGNCTRFGETELSWQIARAGNEYTYFSLKEWGEISEILGEKNMWMINEAFLKQQISLGKTFYASHNIFDASIGTSFYREINYLNDMKINLFQL